MGPIVKYAGREQSGPSEWTVSFDLIDDRRPPQRYWCKVKIGDDRPGPTSPVSGRTSPIWAASGLRTGNSSMRPRASSLTPARRPRSARETPCWS